MSVRGTFVYRNGECVEKYGPLDVREPPARSHLPTPYVIGDTLPDLVGMHDGKHYSSKSALRKSYKASGLVELGNDAPVTHASNAKPAPKNDVIDAYRKVRDGYKPAPLETSVIPDP